VTLSMLVWGIYLLTIGALLLVIPGRTLTLLGHDMPKDHWIQVLGIVTIILAIYYMVAAQNEFYPLYRASIYLRYGALLGFVGLVVTKRAPAKLVVFGLLDGAGATWTLLTMP